jgi:hypothetical protein
MRERQAAWLRRRLRMTGMVGALTILLVGCEFTSESTRAPLAPSDVTITPVLLGIWNFSTAAPSATELPSAESCTELEFGFDAQDGDVYTGTFSATCADGVVLTGTASGTYIDGLVTVHADGLATSSGVQCPFDLSGTARIVGDHIEVDYAGNSCLGPVSGSETLTR